MPQQNNTPQLPTPNFLLEGISLEVKSAQQTHRFLCDIFAQSNTLVSWDPLIRAKGELPKLSSDGKSTTFQMQNTSIQFREATSPHNTVGQRKIKMGVKVQDIAHVKGVLVMHGCKYTSGTQDQVPGRPKWIQFSDLDGYTWYVSELVRN